MAPFGIQPWRCETFKFSTDPQLEAKIRDVAGLYLNPPENAIVLSVDEKSQVQALDRTAPMLRCDRAFPSARPMITTATAPPPCSPRWRSPPVTDACYPRHRHQQFLKFLKRVAKTYPQQQLHLVCDNYATHKRPNVRAWLEHNLRITPALHSDLRILAQHGRDLLRHHHPPSHPPRQLHQVEDLINTIRRLIDSYNDHTKAFGEPTTITKRATT